VFRNVEQCGSVFRNLNCEIFAVLSGNYTFKRLYRKKGESGEQNCSPWVLSGHLSFSVLGRLMPRSVDRMFL
jgi:hypothetical protein